MALFTLRAAEEIRATQFGMAEGALDAEMVAVAKAIITQRTGGFDPTTYWDRYQEALRELIEAKMKGLTETVGTCGAVANRLDRRCHLGQIYPVPAGFLKQPTDTGSTCLGSQSTKSRKKMQNAITAKKTA